MGAPRIPIDPVADLKVRLGRESTDQARAFWARLFLASRAQGTGMFYGVPMAKVGSCVRAWWNDHGLSDHPVTVGKRVALALIEQPMIEDKLAGILVLQDLLGAHLRASDLPAFARLFAAGHLADWNVVDWFVMKVLVTLLDRPVGRREVVRALAQWRTADTTWQRRAACLAFIKPAPLGDAALPGLTDHILTICGTVVWSHEPHDQTAVGCVLRELARAEPGKVEAFFRRHALLMSKDCARHVVAKLPAPLRAELLAHHKRATSLRS
jgi:3-methyladenine DNA glycosylase AlkD